MKSKFWFWNLRYGNLNFASLKLLVSQKMVYGLTKVEDHKGVYEGCSFRKNSRMKFPKGK